MTHDNLPKLYRQIHGRDGSCYFRSFDLGEWLRTYSATPLPEGVTYVPPQETTAGPKDRVILRLRRDLAEVKTARNCLAREVRDLKQERDQNALGRRAAISDYADRIREAQQAEYKANTEAEKCREQEVLCKRRYDKLLTERAEADKSFKSLYGNLRVANEKCDRERAYSSDLRGQVTRISAICEKQKDALNATAADIADQARHVLELQARLDRRENKIKKLKAKLRKAKGSK